MERMKAWWRALTALGTTVSAPISPKNQESPDWGVLQAPPARRNRDPYLNIKFSTARLKPMTKPRWAKNALAMDSISDPTYSQNFNGHMSPGSEGIGFFGFPLLALLAQRVEYRNIVEIWAEECTRKWIKLNGGDEKRVKELSDALDDLNVKGVFRQVIEYDGFYGRGHICIDTGDNDNPREMATPLKAEKEKLGKGGLFGIRAVEAYWAYPQQYDTTDPLSHRFYSPELWNVMGRNIHHTRLLTVVGRPVPDYLKPVYSFGGMPLTQLLKPLIDNYIRNRQSVADMLHGFSTWALKTPMGNTATDVGAAKLRDRVFAFNQLRDNSGLFLLDGGSEEELSNISAPLGGLDALLAQSLEQISASSRIPLVKLLGTTPSGLNASSDGEIRVFYDTVAAYQEGKCRHPLQHIIHLMMVNLWGEIDDSITFDFEPLWQDDGEALARIRKSDADADVAYVAAGVVNPDEVRDRIQNDVDSPYHGIDLSAAAPDIDTLLDEGDDAESEGANPRSA